jgi:hypothetical protein
MTVKRNAKIGVQSNHFDNKYARICRDRNENGPIKT